MKINKSKCSLVLMVGETYEGSLGISYSDKIFGKMIEISDFAEINEESHPLSEKEKTLVNQIDKAIKKETESKGFILDKWNLRYSSNGQGGEILVEYGFGETLNTISFSLMEEHIIPKKSLVLARTITKRLIKELK